MNNWHSIALTGSSPPWSTRRLDIERTSTSLHSLELKWLSSWQALHFFLHSRRASKEQELTLAQLDSAIDQSSLTTITHWPAHLKMASGCLGIWIPAVFCLCLEAKRRARILWCSMKVRSPWAWSVGAGRAHRRTEHYIIYIELNYIELNTFFLFTSYCNLCVLSRIFFNTAPRSPKVGKNVDKSLLIIAVGWNVLKVKPRCYFVLFITTKYCIL